MKYGNSKTNLNLQTPAIQQQLASILPPPNKLYVNSQNIA
jgi:hypothetical protein